MPTRARIEARSDNTPQRAQPHTPSPNATPEAGMADYLGIDIGGTNVKWALMSEGFDILQRGSVPTAFETADNVVAAIGKIAEPFQGQFAGIGVSVPGSVMEGDATGTIHRGGALPYLDGFPLGTALGDAFGVPVAVNNDGKCCALGEYAAGALRGTRTGVVIGIGTGIAGGIVIDGKVLRGAHCFAGEFSFLNNHADAEMALPTSFAGSAGWHGLRLRVAGYLQLPEDEANALDGRKIFSLVESDPRARAALDDYALNFVRTVLNLQAVLDPEVFAIGGGISANPLLVEAMNEQLDVALESYKTWPFTDMPRPNIVQATLGNDANIYGAVQEAMRLS